MIVIMIMIMIMIIVVVAALDVVMVDRDTSVRGAADALAHGGGIAADTDDRNRSNLGNEDQVALGVGRDRMRAGRLRDLLDQRVCLGVDHAEHGRLLSGGRAGAPRDRAVPTGAGVVAAVAFVEPHFVRPG